MRTLITLGVIAIILLAIYRGSSNGPELPQVRASGKPVVKSKKVGKKKVLFKKTSRKLEIKHRSSPGLEVWWFDMRAWIFFLTYTVGGESKRQVRERTRATFVVNGPYFNMNPNQPKQAVNLLWLLGHYYREQEVDLGRPILVFCNSGLRIDRPGQRLWKPRPGDVGAMAIDDFEQPKRRMSRQFIGIKGHRAVVVRIPKATYKEAAYYVRHILKVNNFASFDGGHTYGQNVTAPSHFCAAPKGVRVVRQLSAYSQRYARR